MSDYLDINNEELLKDFFSEAEQQVDTLESNILVIENDPTNHEAIDEIFRAAHTLKGGSATVEMNELSGFTHVIEDLLDALRSGTVTVTEPVVDILLKSLDIIKDMLAARANGSVYAKDVSSVKAKLESMIPVKEPKTRSSAPKKAPEAPKAAPKAPMAAPTAAPVAASSQSFTGLLSEYELLELKESVPPGNSVFVVTVAFDEANPMNTVGGIQVFAALKQKGQVLKTIPDFDALYEDLFHPEVMYFVATDVDAERLTKTATISDVTLGITVSPFDFKSAQGPSPVPASEPAPAAQASAASAPKTAATAAAKAPSEQPEPDKNGVSVEEALAEEKNEAAKKAGATPAVHASGSVLRVDSRRIDYLLNLVSETVITKASFNQSAIQFTELHTQFQQAESQYKEKLRKLLDHIPDYLEQIQAGASMKDLKKEMNAEYADLFDSFGEFEGSMKGSVAKFRSASQNLGRITGELQEGVMKIRMVPISQIFSRFPRLVRDLSRDLNKKVQLVIEGEDTELDKSVIEDLLDPIMHCVRNALDHGVEAPEVRASLGKPEEGTILLKASNEGNMIIIEIADDGHGIDVEAVKKKAVARGIIHPGKNLTDVEAFQLIFEPGFSTAEKITNISGRGVGLDVVRTHIEKLNGTVTISSQPNAGSKFTIRLPLTLAIIQGLLVRVGKEVYSIPITSVIESHRVKGDEISRIDNYEVFNVRNEVISLLRLNRLFGIKSAESAEFSYIVIVGTAEKKVGLMVDSLIGEEDVVIKPLRDQFTNSPGIAGASILGDGSVSLIIDVSQLLDLGLKQELQARERREASVW
ncbi:MAG TPA: chemotaxis protein CheW [Treponemataceae bacterium]|nr:chemotaxis protein CheW [Treponemataceae bacterium]